MRKLVVYGLAATLAGAAATPASGAWTDFNNWNFCTGNALSICMDFNLQQDDVTPTNFQLTATYLNTSVGNDGVITGVGLYRMDADPDLNVSNVVVVSPGDWVVGDNGLEGGGNVLFEVASNAPGNDGPAVGGNVIIAFSSTNLGTYDLTDLHARSHMQSVGINDCSIKPDSRLEGYVVDGVAAVDARCGDGGGGGGGNTVPEPVSLILLGSGLLGIGGVRMRRRRK